MLTQKDNRKSLRRKTNIFSPAGKRLPITYGQKSPPKFPDQPANINRSLSTCYVPKAKKTINVIQTNRLTQQLNQQSKDFKPFQYNKRKQNKILHVSQSPNPRSFLGLQNPHNQLGQKPIQQSTNHIMSILIFNQQKLQILQNTAINLKTFMLQMYSKHQQQLKQKVALRCQQFTDMFKKTLYIIKAKSNYINQIDQKINVYAKIMRETQQKLRLLKLKQQCIEYVSKPTLNKNSLSQKSLHYNHRQTKIKEKQSDFGIKLHNFIPSQAQQFYQQEQISDFWKIQQINSQRQQNYNRKNNNIQSNTMVKLQQKVPKYNLSPNKETDNHNKINSYKTKNFDIKEQSFFDFDKPQNSLCFQNTQKLSPFQANQLIHKSNFSTYQSSYEPIKQHYHNNIKAKHIQQNPQVSLEIRKQILNLIKKQTNSSFTSHRSKSTTSPLQCYLDHLGYLRRPNGTYIYKSDNSMIMLSNKQFEQFINEGLLDDSLFRKM